MALFTKNVLGIYTPKGDCLPQGIILEAFAAYGAPYTAVHPASPVSRRQISESEHQVPTLGLRIFSPPLYQLSYVPMLHRKTLCDTVLLSQSWDMRFRVHSRKLAIPLLVSEPPRNSTQGRLPCSLRHTCFVFVGTTDTNVLIITARLLCP